MIPYILQKKYFDLKEIYTLYIHIIIVKILLMPNLKTVVLKKILVKKP